MEPEVFNFWYFTLDLQPFTKKLLHTCVNNSTCKNCKKRLGCPLRPLFYMDDLTFEIFLQSSELKVGNFLSQMADDDPESATDQVFNSAEKIRFKRKSEVAEHKIFSEK